MAHALLIRAHATARYHGFAEGPRATFMGRRIALGPTRE